MIGDWEVKLKDACDIAIACGLTTVGEAWYNIKMHAISIFDYSKINEELTELRDEINLVGDVTIEDYLNSHQRDD